jgi:surfactin synthase thioesterase subunit
VETLTKVLDKDLDRPFAIFGHSVGALLGYAWCLQLVRSGRPLPQHLIVSAYTCPTLKNPILMEMKRAYREAAGLQTLPSVEDVLDPANEMLVNRLVNVAQAGVADMRLGDRFAAATQDVIRAQLVNGVAALQLVDGFDPASIVPLTIPITALHGDRDEQVSLDEMQAWGPLTTSAFTCKSFPGNHVFVDPDQCEADVIQEVIRLLLPDQGKLQNQSI